MSVSRTTPRYVVIGSGPSGTAAAAALLDAGAEVVMVDIGADLTAASRGRAARLAASAPTDWQAEDRQWIAAGLDPAANHIPLKTLFGESFMYGREIPLPKGFRTLAKPILGRVQPRVGCNTGSLRCPRARGVASLGGRIG